MERDNSCISWKSLPWALFERKVFQLQCKIYKAKQSGNSILVKRLQKLLIHSKSAHCIATRLITDFYDNRRFSECEKYLIASNIQYSLKGDLSLSKFRLSESNKSLESKKILAIQYILRLALEPIYHEKLEWTLLKRGRRLIKLVKKLSYQVKRAFKCGWKKVLRFEVIFSQANINYSSFISCIGLPFKYKSFIYNILMITYLDNYKRVTSLTNFLRDILVDKILNRSYFSKDLLSYRSNLGNFSVTYSNTVVCFLKQSSNLYNYIDELRKYLSNHGLVLYLPSIYISTLCEGFDFFGWFFKKQINKKVFISFSRNSWMFYKKLFRLVLHKNYSCDFKIKKIILLNLNLIRRYEYISRSKFRSKFYFIKRLIFRYSKILTSPEKRVLFESLRLKPF